MRALTWIALLAWAAFLYWGVKAAKSSVFPNTLASDLPQNHLLTANDLLPKGSDGAMLYSGLYLKEACQKGSQIKPEDVSISPSLSISPSSAVFISDLPSDTTDKRDAGQQLDLRIGSTVIGSRLIAVLCSWRAGGKCRAVFEVPQSQLKSLIDATEPVQIVDTPKPVPVQPSNTAEKPNSNKTSGKQN